MSILSLLILSLPILTGALIIRLLWVDQKDFGSCILCLWLGAGLGFGLSALLYYIYLLFFAGSPYFLYAELALFLMVLAAVYAAQKKTAADLAPGRWKISLPQMIILFIAGAVFAISFWSLLIYSRQTAYGDWDAWMIFNRSARFIYRSPLNWQDAFSKDMNLLFHADYPPLLALNIASRWEALGHETTHVPMLLGLSFSLAAFGICFGALANLASLGQAALGVILLGGVGFFLSEGGRQTADVPLAVYILSSVVFLFFHARQNRAVFVALSAFMAGLAAWTKNEGLLFALASVAILFLAALWRRSFRDFLFYLLGLALPLSLLLHFKLQVSPASEFLNGGTALLIQNLTDESRHRLIFGAFRKFFLYGGGWAGIGIFSILGMYFLLFFSRSHRNARAVYLTLAILVMQLLGYYVFYLISPYDLNWHISYSLNRLFVHIYPSTVFVVLAASQPPETIFSPA